MRKNRFTEWQVAMGGECGEGSWHRGKISKRGVEEKQERGGLIYRDGRRDLKYGWREREGEQKEREGGEER